jgi:hypothetical protein
MELLELGTTMVAKYLGEAAPLIQPAAVESRVAGIIGGVRVSGYVDLLDVDGRLIDSKSAIKPIKGIAHDHRLQLTSYAMITPAATGACRLDTVTKGKTVTLVQKSFCVSEKDRQYAEMFIRWSRIPFEMASFCRAEAARYVRNGTAATGRSVRPNTAAASATTKRSFPNRAR